MSQSHAWPSLVKVSPQTLGYQHEGSLRRRQSPANEPAVMSLEWLMLQRDSVIHNPHSDWWRYGLSSRFTGGWWFCKACCQCLLLHSHQCTYRLPRWKNEKWVSPACLPAPGEKELRSSWIFDTDHVTDVKIDHYCIGMYWIMIVGILDCWIWIKNDIFGLNILYFIYVRYLEL